MFLFGSPLVAFFVVDHFEQIVSSFLDVGVVVLRGALLGSDHAPAVYLVEVAEGELVPPFSPFAVVGVDSEIPLRESVPAVLVEILVFFVGRRLAFAPVGSVGIIAFFDQVLANLTASLLTLTVITMPPHFY